MEDKKCCPFFDNEYCMKEECELWIGTTIVREALKVKTHRGEPDETFDYEEEIIGCAFKIMALKK